MRQLIIIIVFLQLSTYCFGQDWQLYYQKVREGDEKAKEGAYSSAMKDYTFAINLIPTYDFAYAKRALLKMQLNDYRGALLDYNKLISINKLESDFFRYNHYVYRAICKYELRNYWGALEDCNIALKLYEKCKKEDPDDFDTNYGEDKGLILKYRGLSKIKIKLVNEGCQDLSTAGELGADVYDSIEYFCN